MIVASFSRKFWPTNPPTKQGGSLEALTLYHPHPFYTKFTIQISHIKSFVFLFFLGGFETTLESNLAEGLDYRVNSLVIELILK